MKYLLKYNEGIFTSENDNEVLSKIINVFDKTKPVISSTSDDTSITYNVDNLKLDTNEGSYNIVLKRDNDNKYDLTIKYVKHGNLLLIQKLNCNNDLYMTLYNKILAKYITD